MIVSVSRIHELLEYNTDGSLTWKVRTSSRVRVGDRAGSAKPTGYRHINIDGRRYKEHRVIFAMHHGEWPPQIDHRNLVRGDNRIDNLRASTQSQNNGNSPIRKDNKLGAKGVSMCSTTGKFRVFVCGKSIGRYGTLEEAKEAYESAATERFGEFARLS